MLSGGISTFITDVVKHMVGRPRPNFVAYCKWLEASGCGNPTPDAWASFVSGHSSLSFATLTILSLYLLTVVRASKRQAAALASASSATSTDCLLPCNNATAIGVRYELQQDDKVAVARRIELATAPDNVAWIYCVCLLPMLLAGWIALTRIVDYWHNTDDVLGGAAIGLGCAVMVGRFKLKSLEYAQPGTVEATSPSSSPAMPSASRIDPRSLREAVPPVETEVDQIV